MMRIKVAVDIPAAPRGATKVWRKLIRHVDTSKETGYAFEGEWLEPGRKVELEVGDYVLVYDEVQHRQTAWLACALSSGLHAVSDARGEIRAEGRGWALAIRDRVAALVNKAVLSPTGEMLNDYWQDRGHGEIVSADGLYRVLRVDHLRPAPGSEKYVAIYRDMIQLGCGLGRIEDLELAQDLCLHHKAIMDRICPGHEKSDDPLVLGVAALVAKRREVAVDRNGDTVTVTVDRASRVYTLGGAQA